MNLALRAYLEETSRALEERLQKDPPFSYVPEELMEGTFAYFRRGGKRLRPAVCRLSAGALGGEKAEQTALPCALALEFYHNWTLIHDDVIDHDDFRRGSPAVHRLTADIFREKYGENKAEEYGLANAILAGDALHSAAVRALAGADAISPEVTLEILRLLEGEYGPRLIAGEAIDTRNGVLFGADAFYRVPREEILSMMAGKTGALFGISARSGALIGLGSPRPTAEVDALTEFAECCGIAFQLQDDVLGLTSTDAVLGKPVGSDIREGKATILLITSYQNATEAEQAFLRDVVGKKSDGESVEKARQILLSRGGMEECLSLAKTYLNQAEESLLCLPASRYRDLLWAWMDTMVNREF